MFPATIRTYIEDWTMLLGPLQHQRRAKLVRQKAQSAPLHKKARLLQLAGLHQAGTEEAGAEGKPQLVIPGAERISDAELAPKEPQAQNRAPSGRSAPVW